MDGDNADDSCTAFPRGIGPEAYGTGSVAFELEFPVCDQPAATAEGTGKRRGVERIVVLVSVR